MAIGTGSSRFPLITSWPEAGRASRRGRYALKSGSPKQVCVDAFDAPVSSTDATCCLPNALLRVRPHLGNVPAEVRFLHDKRTPTADRRATCDGYTSLLERDRVIDSGRVAAGPASLQH